MIKTILALLAALSLSLPALAPPAWALPKPGSQIPPLSLPDASGQPHNLAHMAKDKVAVVVYWSISCPHCRVEMPHLLKLNRELSGNPFVMIMINGDGMDMARAAQKMSRDFKLPEPCLIDSGPNDTMPAADAFGVVATPTILVYNRAGKLIQAQELKVDMEKLTQAVTGAF